MSNVPVGPGTRVTLSFSLALQSGEEIDSVDDATFEVGDGSLLPGFEKALFGLRVGDEKKLDIPAGQAFGLRQAENLHLMKRENFTEMELKQGLVVSFADAQGNELPGVVAEISDDAVTVDFNHPLAGKDIRFDVSIQRVEQISSEIARM